MTTMIFQKSNSNDKATKDSTSGSSKRFTSLITISDNAQKKKATPPTVPIQNYKSTFFKPSTAAAKDKSQANSTKNLKVVKPCDKRKFQSEEKLRNED